MAFGREVHLADDRFENRTKTARHDRESISVHPSTLDFRSVRTACRRLTAMTATIEIVETPTDEVVTALARLLPQLSSATPPNASELATIIAGGSTFSLPASMVRSSAA